jgi:3-dehydroquinate dehydratase type I
MINRQDVVNVLLRAKREGHLIVHLQRKRFWQSAAKGSALYGWPFVDLSHVPFSQSKLGKAPNILSSKLFTPDKLKQLTEKIYATRPEESELKSGVFTPYIPGRLARLSREAAPVPPAAAKSAAEAGNLSDPGSKTRAWLAEQMESAVFSEQIEALYRKARSHQFYAIYDDTRSMAGNAELSARDFYALMYRLARLDRYAPGVGGLVVSVTSKTVAELLVPARGDAGIDRLTELTVGADAVELRVDMLAAASYASREYLKAQYSLLRRHCPLPVIWTVRSVGQGGEFAGGEEEYVMLAKLGAELGAEAIDVEACWSESARLSLMRSRRHSAVISSYTETRAMGRAWTAGQLAEWLGSMAGACEGRSDAVKLVVESADPGQAGEMREALEVHRRDWPGVPAVGLCVGRQYAQSVVENRVLSHVSLYSPRGLPPSLREVHRRRLDAGLTRPVSVYVAAADDAARAPLLHALGEGLAAAGLSDAVRTLPLRSGADPADAATAGPAEAAVEAVRGVLGLPDTAAVVAVGGAWGGCLSALADELSPAAIFIGETDFLRVRRRAAKGPGVGGGRGGPGVVTRGVNTEWVGLRSFLRAAPARRGLRQPARVAVVGGGPGLRAALYALESMPDARVAKPVALYCQPDPPPDAPPPDPALDMARDFASCRAVPGGSEALAAAAAAGVAAGEAFDVVLSFLAPDAHAAIPDALLVPAGATVLVVEGRALGAGSPLAERCRALGASYVAGGEVLRETVADMAARLP